MGRKNRTRWGALAWPGICRATASALTDESRRLGGLSMRAEAIGAIGPRDELGAEAVACRDYAAILAAGERIWVSADMVAATTDAAADVPSLDTIDMPAARGCLGLAAPLPLIDLGHPLWLRTPDGGDERVHRADIGRRAGVDDYRGVGAGGAHDPHSAPASSSAWH